MDESLFPDNAFGTRLERIDTEAMASGLVLMILVADASVGEGSIKHLGVVVMDNWVIDTIDQKDRRHVVTNVQFERKAVLPQGLAFAVFAQQGSS